MIEATKLMNEWFTSDGLTDWKILLVSEDCFMYVRTTEYMFVLGIADTTMKQRTEIVLKRFK